MKIYFALDENCISSEKLNSGLMGGTEQLLIVWIDDLIKRGYEVDTWYNKKDIEYDLCIHSNIINNNIKAGKHLLWCSSDHAAEYPVDKADLILCSQLMKDRLGWDTATVIYSFFDTDILKCKIDYPIKNHIVCHSNPNRHIFHTKNICKELDNQGIDFKWSICGGNKLYSNKFTEVIDFNTSHPRIHYHGLLTHTQAISLVASAHVWVYPNFTVSGELYCVSMLEAATLGIPVIVPNERPYTDLIPEAIFCNNEQEMVEAIKKQLTTEERFEVDLSHYRKEYILDLLHNEVVKLTGGS